MALPCRLRGCLQRIEARTSGWTHDRRLHGLESLAAAAVLLSTAPGYGLYRLLRRKEAPQDGPVDPGDRTTTA